MKVLNKIFVLTFIAVAVTTISNAAEPIGRVVKLRGEVLASNKTSGESATLKDGDSIYEGDTLKSEKSAFAKILMKDDTIFQLGPNTEMIFEKFKFESKKKRTATYNLLKGQLRSLFTVKSKEKSLMIKTPNAAMGIRGTEILSDVYKFEGKVKTDIALLSGKLDVDLKAMKLGESLKKSVIQLMPGEVFESDHFRKNFTGGKSIKKLIKRLPKKLFNNLKKSQKKGGQIFLFEARKQVRRDLYNGARFNFDRTGKDVEILDAKEGGILDAKELRTSEKKRGEELPRGTSQNKLKMGISPIDKKRNQQKQRQKEMKENQRKKQALVRREEMVRRRQARLAKIRKAEIQKIIFGRFSAWREGLSPIQRLQIKNTYNVSILTPEIFCQVRPNACAF